MAESNPLRKEVAHQAGAWLINFNKYPLPVGYACPGCGAAAVDGAVLTHVERALAFVTSSLTIACVILTAGVTMFPFVMPSSTSLMHQPDHVGCDLQSVDAGSDDRCRGVSLCLSFWGTPLVVLQDVRPSRQKLHREQQAFAVLRRD
jgi:cytochrome bd-type quinol oxidase subunit 2